MENVIAVSKARGQTPLDVIRQFKAKHPKYRHSKISYAGRLDPMAEGILLLLIGDENKKRHTYEAYKKTYEFSVLFGLETDSYDLLGIPNTMIVLHPINYGMIQKYLRNHTGRFLQEFPPFSSKTVNGVPLYRLSREGRTKSLIFPKKEITVYSFSISKRRSITSSALLKKITKDISSVQGDFRQEKILRIWNNLLTETELSFPILEFEITCSSGTYVRSISHEMGKFINIPSLAFQIKRTAVGPYTFH